MLTKEERKHTKRAIFKITIFISLGVKQDIAFADIKSQSTVSAKKCTSQTSLQLSFVYGCVRDPLVCNIDTGGGRAYRKVNQGKTSQASLFPVQRVCRFFNELKNAWERRISLRRSDAFCRVHLHWQGELYIHWPYHPVLLCYPYGRKREISRQTAGKLMLWAQNLSSLPYMVGYLTG